MIRAAAYIAVVLLGGVARAQIVNVQPLVAKAEMKPGFHLAVEGAVDYRSGNINLLTTSGRILTRYRHGAHHVFLMLTGEFGIKNGATFLSRNFEHLRYRPTLWGVWDGELFVQHERDEFRRIANRVVAGAGLRLRVIMTHRIESAIAAAYMMEYEQLRQDTQPDAGIAAIMHRTSMYATVTVRLTDRLMVAETVYVQPRINQTNDLRLLSDSELLIVVGRYFSIKMAASLAFDTVPPIAVVPFDVRLGSSLVANY